MTNKNNEIKGYMLEDMLQADVARKFNESERLEYFVSIYGNFYSRHKNTGRVIQMKVIPDGEGYLRCQISGKTTNVHITVAEVFLRKRDRAKNEVIHHLDGDRTNNNLSNLNITTQSNNIKYAWKDKKERTRLTYEKAEQIRLLHEVEGMTFNGLARMFDCSATSIRQILLGLTFIKKPK